MTSPSRPTILFTTLLSGFDGLLGDSLALVGRHSGCVGGGGAESYFSATGEKRLNPKKKAYQKVTIMPLCRSYGALYFQVKTTSLRVVVSCSALKVGYMDRPSIHVSSATWSFKMMTKGNHAAIVNK